MRAVVMREHGGPEVLEVLDVERPKPGPAEVLIRTAAAGVSPVDWQVRQGSWVPDAMGEPPMILGWDVAGRVEEAGDDVLRFEPGDRVFGLPRFPELAGCDAEYVAAPERFLALIPDSIGDEQAGAMPLAGLTAWQALDSAEVGEGDRVLVHAAAGGVGHLAVQIAKPAARRDRHRPLEKHAFLRELGVDEPIDYTAGPLEETVSDVDVVLDLVSEDDDGLIRSLATLGMGGLLVAVAGELGRKVVSAAGEQAKRATAIDVEPDRAGLESLASLTVGGELEVVIEEAFPLELLGQAHERLQAGRVSGKLVLVTA